MTEPTMSKEQAEAHRKEEAEAHAAKDAKAADKAATVENTQSNKTGVDVDAARNNQERVDAQRAKAQETIKSRDDIAAERDKALEDELKSVEQADKNREADFEAQRKTEQAEARAAEKSDRGNVPSPKVSPHVFTMKANDNPTGIPNAHDVNDVNHPANPRNELLSDGSDAPGKDQNRFPMAANTTGDLSEEDRRLLAR